MLLNISYRISPNYTKADPFVVLQGIGQEGHHPS